MTLGTEALRLLHLIVAPSVPCVVIFISDPAQVIKVGGSSIESGIVEMNGQVYRQNLSASPEQVGPRTMSVFVP
jgi:hypothetical protein